MAKQCTFRYNRQLINWAENGGNMRAVIKSYHSPDVIDLDNYLPDNDAFCVLLELYIGTDEEIGEEQFMIKVCTPQWFVEHYKENDMIFCHGVMIVFKFDFELIMKRINHFVNTKEGDTWSEIATEISRYFIWEFEGYKE